MNIIRKETVGGSPSSGEEEGESSEEMEQVTHLFAQQNLHQVPTERLQAMSLDERVEAQQDLHGILDIVKESPELIQAKLLELDAAVSSLVRDGGKTLPLELTWPLQQATTKNKEYAQSLRLSFLRADAFDADKAALRMARHFAARCRFFGEDVLLRDIRISDFAKLGPTNQVALKTGIIQLLPHKDRVGRPIILMNPSAAGKEPFDFLTMARVLFWMTFVAAEKAKESQQKGVVVIWYGVGTTQSPERNGRGPGFMELFDSSNIRLCSVHGCFSDPALTPLMNEICALSRSKYVVRFQTHLGNHVECLGNLVTFGIPREMIPITKDGHVHLLYHKRFLRQLEETETSVDELSVESPVEAAAVKGALNDSMESSATDTRADSREEIISISGPMDVILGRGRRGAKSPGNILLKKLQEEYLDAYNVGNNLEKSTISHHILLLIRAAGGRFIDPVFDKDNPKIHKGRAVPIGWKEIDDEAARYRIGNGFRNLRKTYVGI